MSTYMTKKTAELAQRLAAQKAENDRLLAEIRAEQEAHERKLAEALSKAGPARVALVEDLLEKFAVPVVEPVIRRNKRTGEVVLDKKTGAPATVDPDPDETVRMRNLAAAIDALIERDRAQTVQGLDTVVGGHGNDRVGPDDTAGASAEVFQ